MTKREDRARGWVFPLAVLLAGAALCWLILWAGGHVGTLIPSGRNGASSQSAAVEETIASAITFGLLLAAGLAGGAVCGINAARFGVGGGVRVLEGAAIGLVGLLIATALAGLAGVLRQSHGGSSAGLFVWGSAIILLQTGSEEVFFRGWIQPILVKSWGAWGILVTAIAFALLHLLGGATSMVSVANLFLGGILFGLLAARDHGIAGAVAAHFSWNWSEQLVLGLDPNPGNGSFGSILNLDLVGSSWWGGSGEGLNASVGMTFALAILLAPILIYGVKTRQSLEQHQPGRVAA